MTVAAEARFFGMPDGSREPAGALGEYIESPPQQERRGHVLYDTLDLGEARFTPEKCASYRLFCGGSYRPDKCNLDSAGALPCGSHSMVVTTLGVRVDLNGPAAEDMLHIILRTGVAQLHLGGREYVHLPLARLYPNSGDSVAPIVLSSEEHGGSVPSGIPTGGPYRTHQEEVLAQAGPALLPTVHGAIEVEALPDELDPLGRPSWLRGGYCRFAFVVPSVRIEPMMNFRVDVGFGPYGCGVLQSAKDNGLLRGELVVYLGGVYMRDIL
jgi:hypothetical protein